MEKNIDIYNDKEKCFVKSKIFYNNLEEIKGIKEIYIFCHGFCSGKGSNSVKIVSEKLLEYEIPSISFDFPGHIDSVQGSDKLNTEVCISYIDSVIKYIKENYGSDVEISLYAISYGAFILLNKLKTDTSEYKNIILRSPAINMADIFINCLLKTSFDEYEKIGIGKSGHGGKIEVPYTFYEDLLRNNIMKSYSGKRKILIFQGKLDDTASIKDTYEFIRNRPQIELIEMSGMKHHMNIEEIQCVTKEMIDRLNANND